MPNARQFENCIKETLTEVAEYVTATNSLKDRIYNSIRNQSNEEVNVMKINRLFTPKKIAVIAAVVCCLTTVLVFAAGKINSYVTVTSKNPTFTEVPDSRELSRDLGYLPKVVESFANGYKFKNASISNSKGMDKDGNTVSKSRGLSMKYASDNGQGLCLTVNKHISAEEEAINKNTEVVTYNGVKMLYSEQKYKVVPKDYEMTSEDKKAQDSGELVFSFGSDKVIISTVKTLSWTDNDMDYVFLGMNSQIAKTELADMAGELIDK